MEFKAETITVLPAMILFAMASYFAFLTSYIVDSPLRKVLVIVALGLFIAGLILAVCWGCYWGILKEVQKNREYHIAMGKVQILSRAFP